MAVRVRVESTELKRALSAATRRARRMRPAWRQVGELLLRSIAENFSQEGRPRSWEPWAPSTAARRGPGGRILDETGRLRSSIRARTDARGVTVETSVRYGGFHQEGTRRMPARPFLLVQPEDEREIEDIIAQYLIEPLQ